MALDGITVAALAAEIREKCLGGRITRIAEPESNEILLTVRSTEQYRLLLSADPSLPLIYLTKQNKPSPMTAPGFLMLLRKHLQGGRITAVTQPGLERAVRIEVEHLNELGDLCRKALILELMGKYSNLIFTDDEDRILDAVRRVPSSVSSVREVLPGRPYFLPNTQNKTDPLEIGAEEFSRLFDGSHAPLEKALGEHLTGLSPLAAREISCLSGLDGSECAGELPEEARLRVYKALQSFLAPVRTGDFSPRIYFHRGKMLEFSAVPLSVYGSEEFRIHDSMSEAMEAFFAEKSAAGRIRQRSADLRHILQLALERTSRKLDLQQKQLKDTEKRDKLKRYGELLKAYGWQAEPGAKELICADWNDGDREVRVPLDETLSASENAQKYFERYQKLKRTFEATTQQIAETEADLEYLRSVSAHLASAESEADLSGIKAELAETGWIRKNKGAGRKEKAPKAGQPLRFVTSDGFTVFVGKNNLQNEEVTFKLASGNDWWFHVKGQPGSHVVVRTEGRELPDRSFEEAAALAAWYSSAPRGEKTEVDYTRRREIKKPGLYKPGMVVYHTNYSMMVIPALLERQP